MIDTIVPTPTEADEANVVDGPPKMSARGVGVFYGEKQALRDVSVDIHDDKVTAFIGPSGCGKSTFLRCLNRMNDTIAGARVTFGSSAFSFSNGPDSSPSFNSENFGGSITDPYLRK